MRAYAAALEAIDAVLADHKLSVSEVHALNFDIAVRYALDVCYRDGKITEGEVDINCRLLSGSVEGLVSHKVREAKLAKGNR